MKHGTIKAFAQCWLGEMNCFRFLIVTDGNWYYLYLGATNYKFRENDIVSWCDDCLLWYTDSRTIKFDLLQSAIGIA